MKTFRFKTNLKCDGCITAITPQLNNHPHISKWEVDVSAPEKPLTVEGNGIEAQEIVLLLNAVGYQATLL